MRVHIGVNKPEQLLHLLTMLDLSYMIQDMTTDINTTATQFKLVTLILTVLRTLEPLTPRTLVVVCRLWQSGPWHQL